jgi:hypothetical protein
MPRDCGGASSETYTGAVTEVNPIPIPMIARATISMATSVDSGASTEPRMKMPDGGLTVSCTEQFWVAEMGPRPPLEPLESATSLDGSQTLMVHRLDSCCTPADTWRRST